MFDLVQLLLEPVGDLLHVVGVQQRSILLLQKLLLEVVDDCPRSSLGLNVGDNTLELFLCLGDVDLSLQFIVLDLLENLLFELFQIPRQSV